MTKKKRDSLHFVAIVGAGRIHTTRHMTHPFLAGDYVSLQAIHQQGSASIVLRRKHGFRELGVMERPGQMPDGRWRDVLIMERRSRVAGRT